MKIKKILTTVLSLALVAALSIAGTVAYLTYEDSDVNVMTLGNVKIEQIEQEWKEGELVDFTQGKPLYPVVGQATLENEDVDNGAYRRLDLNNIVDKYVSVKNIGKSDAYIRTAFAFEMGDLTEVEFRSMVNILINSENDADNPLGDWYWVGGFASEKINGDSYYIMAAIHKTPVAPGQTTIPSLLQVYLSSEATNETVDKLDGNGNGLYDILVKSQAIQAAGFEDFTNARDNTGILAAMAALDEGFGYVEDFNVPKIFFGLETNDGYITSYTDYKAVKSNSGSYIVLNDFISDDIIVFAPNSAVSLNLNEKTITAGKVNQFIFGAQYGSKLYLSGDGVVNAGTGFMTNKGDAQIIIDNGTYNTTDANTNTKEGIKFTSAAQNNSKIVINGGTFTTNVEDACLFFATSNARIEINGGFFENTADTTPDLLSMGTNGGNTNRIVITGGTFVNWNPLNDRMCYTGEWPENGESALNGPWMLIPGGYEVVTSTRADGAILYTVQKVK